MGKALGYMRYLPHSYFCWLSLIMLRELSDVIYLVSRIITIQGRSCQREIMTEGKIMTQGKS